MTLQAEVLDGRVHVYRWNVSTLAWVAWDGAHTAPGYDSGLVTLPTTLTVVTASTIRARGVLLCNLTTAAVTVTITNTAGTQYLQDYPLQAGMTVYVPMGDATMVGVKWQASAAASVNGQVVGDV